MTTRTKRTTPGIRARRSAREAARNARSTGAMMRETWGAAVHALTAAEEEMARQLRLLLRRNKVTPKDASAAIAGLTARLERQRRNLGHTLDSAMHGALASLNIPSRQEVAELTRKVDELSRRIGGAPTRRRAPRRRTASARA